MLKHKIERFLTYISMQMPALMSRSNYAGAEIFDGMAVLEFRLPKPCDIGDLLDEFDDQMELTILYHVIPSEATVMGHQCCAYSNPSFDSFPVIGSSMPTLIRYPFPAFSTNPGV